MDDNHELMVFPRSRNDVNIILQIITNAGHHVYADDQSWFNRIVTAAGTLADKFLRN